MELTIIVAIALVTSFIPLFVYGIYILFASMVKDRGVVKLDKYPDISIVIPAYNEEDGIGDRIHNLCYVFPTDSMEIIVSDDGSSDDTVAKASEALNKYGVKGHAITDTRGGVNLAINRGINEATKDIVVITGADGLFDENTIPDLLSVLTSSKDIGAVSGDLVPIAKGDSIFSKAEHAYRSIYGKICTWESNVHSTYCFNGPVVAFKKEAASTLNTRRGADDASMALSVIKRGYKCKYVPSAKFYEYVPDKFYEQRRQKIRRATRLLEATFVNKDVIFSNCGMFRTIVFPLRLLMFFVVPTMFFLSIILWTYILFTGNILYATGFIGLFALILIIGKYHANIISSFIIYQGYLFLGLFNMLRDVHTWEPTERVKI